MGIEAEVREERCKTANGRNGVCKDEGTAARVEEEDGVEVEILILC